MPLNLNDLLKKAEKKGITKNSVPSPTQLLRPWQQESVLYNVENKLESNLSQTEAKLEPELESNLSQSEVKLESSTVPLDINSDKLESKVEPELEPKLSQTRVKVKSKLSQTRVKVEPRESFFKLNGLQRKIVLFIHEICQTILEQQTNPLSIEFIAMQCNHPKSSVRKAIQRLEQKGIIVRADFKNGRGGWTQYQLPDQVYQEILRIKNQKLEPNLSQSWVKLESNLSQSEAKLKSELEPQLRPSASSSSSLSIKTTTTELGDDWNFDITPYARFGFTFTQLKQLASLGVISAADVEQSLIAFNFDLDNNALPPIKTSKINFFMGLLRGGHAYTSEAYRNEQETIILEMARREEVKRKSLLEAKFVAWEASLSDEERKEIENKLPTHLMVLHRTYGISNTEVRDWLFNYYLQIKPKE